MRYTAPSFSPCIEAMRRQHAAWLLPTTAAVAIMLTLALAGCQTTKNLPPPQTVQTSPVPAFACDTTAQEIMCASETLANLDKTLTTSFHRVLRRNDTFGRDRLIAEQTRWLIGRAGACKVATLRIDPGTPAQPALLSCLARIYSERIDALGQWPAVAANTSADKAVHPLTAYVEFRQAEYGEPQLCTSLADTFNAALRSRGDIDIPRIPGMSALAGTHAETSTTAPRGDAAGFRVEFHDAGPYAGYAMRARSVKAADGRVLLDENSLGNWIRRLPNHGGRPNTMASQTDDYAIVDVFRHTGGILVLLAEPWGKYASGAQGEWAYAGVYQIGVNAAAEPLCLYRTYMTPPLKNEFARLPTYNAMLELLAQMHGPTSAELVGRDLHDAHLFKLEQQWMMQNMPLIALGEARRHGWQGWLRMRHDAVLDALFSWSKRSLHNKMTYNRLLTMLPVAGEEIADTYQRTQRLTPDDAREAAGMTFMRLLAYYAPDLPGSAVDMPNAPATIARYRPKYPLIATAADIQRDRSYTGLYSAVLNGADPEVIDDYIRYEYADRKTRLTHGAHGETALMAAVVTPEIIRRLLAAGAGANEEDEHGRTALMNAAAVGQPETARLLIAAGARVSARTRAADTGGKSACDLIGRDIRPENRATLQSLLCVAAGNGK